MVDHVLDHNLFYFLLPIHSTTLQANKLTLLIVLLQLTMIKCSHCVHCSYMVDHVATLVIWTMASEARSQGLYIRAGSQRSSPASLQGSVGYFHYFKSQDMARR